MLSNARTIMCQLMIDLLRNSNKVYFPELKFMASVEATVILCVIFLQQLMGKPYTEGELRASLQMSKGTMERRIKWLRDHGWVVKRKHRLAVDLSTLSTQNAHTARDIIIAAGVALAKMTVPPV